MEKSYHVALEDAGEYSSIRLLFQGVAPKSRVLDVGCAVGDLGVALLRYKQCEVWGVEYDFERARQAGETHVYQEVFQFDLNMLAEQGIDGLPNDFDFIVFGDVLEHLQQPEQVLRHLMRYLGKDGRVLLSLPNVAHGSVKCQLLLNEFRYTDIGLLDDSHLRFFTWQSIAGFCTSVGAKIEKSERSYLGLECFGFPPDYSRLPNFILQYIFQDPHSYICQYVLTLSLNDMENKQLADHNRKQLICGFDDFPDFMYRYASTVLQKFGAPALPEKGSAQSVYGGYFSIKVPQF